MGRFTHSGHLLKVAALFIAGLGAFLALRGFFIPADFGIYGHYRAGALDDAQAPPVVFAGQKACADCHTDVVETRQATRHVTVSCETCHGPLASHASGDDATTAPKPPDGRTACLTCHVKNVSKPAGFPQVIPAEHADEGACTACHEPHKPAIS